MNQILQTISLRDLKRRFSSGNIEQRKMHVIPEMVTEYVCSWCQNPLPESFTYCWGCGALGIAARRLAEIYEAPYEYNEHKSDGWGASK